jgi:gliding motility-associated-like protein
VHTYRDTGLYAVVQIVTHPSGCKDTLIQYIDIKPEVRYFLPNAFTPNGDSVNDGFKGEGIMDGATNFRMSIWNRWGELVFETTNPDQSWNGRKGNNGPEAPAGVYLVLVSYDEPRGSRIEIKGYATLIK